jgi:hypothetical protein
MPVGLSLYSALHESIVTTGCCKGTCSQLQHTKSGAAALRSAVIPWYLNIVRETFD